jgi:osmotically-inducible protein OsmY
MRATVIGMVIGLSFVSASVGCADMQKDVKSVEGDVKNPGDDMLKAAVTAELVKADKVKAATVQVEAKSGVVTLSGTGDKAGAEKIAKGVPGVTKVVNDMK